MILGAILYAGFGRGVRVIIWWHFDSRLHRVIITPKQVVPP